LVWQLSCWVEQFIRHEVLAVALLPVVAAPLAGEPGTTQAAWHVAAVELQLIMQFVVAELCARRSDWLFFAAADPAPTAPASDSRMQTASAARTPFSPFKSSMHNNAILRAAKSGIAADRAWGHWGERAAIDGAPSRYAAVLRG
jgi:hypothetical protein